MFDVNSFMNTATDAATSTKFLNPPDGDDLVGQITKVEAREISTERNPHQIVMDVTFDIIDQRAVEVTHRPNGNFARYSIFLDTTDGGSLDMREGLNVKLGKLREAVHQNQPGRPWAPSMLVGQTCKCKLQNRKDDNTGMEYCDVKAVLPL